MELDLDVALVVAVDFFTFGTGDDCSLLAEDFGLEVFQCRAVRDVPRRGSEAVAVALRKTIGLVGVAGNRFFQYLGLLAFVLDAGQ